MRTPRRDSARTLLSKCAREATKERRGEIPRPLERQPEAILAVRKTQKMHLERIKNPHKLLMAYREQGTGSN